MKKIIYSCLIIFFVSVLSSIVKVTTVYGDKGDLKINNQVIYQNGEGSQDNMTTFTVHDLFLPEMNLKQDELKEKSNNLIKKAQKTVFVTNTFQEKPMSDRVTTNLFSKDYTMAEEKRQDDYNEESSSKVGWIVLVIIVGILTIGLGIFLGRAYPKFLRKN